MVVIVPGIVNPRRMEDENLRKRRQEVLEEYQKRAMMSKQDAVMLEQMFFAEVETISKFQTMSATEMDDVHLIRALQDLNSEFYSRLYSDENPKPYDKKVLLKVDD